MIKKALIIGIFILLCLQLLLNISYADNAEVLPKGVSRLGVETSFYFPIDQRYNPDGNVEDIAIDFNTSLNSSVFPALSLVETAFGMPAGSATMGSSVVSFEYSFQNINLALQYGVTDKLSAGIVIPYRWEGNDVSAILNTSSATVGKNATINSLAPLAFPGTVPLTTEDVQNLLGNGLDINSDGTIDVPGFGFKRFETWSDNGFLDIEAGLRYQYLKTEGWRLAFTGGARFPTGKVDDPDNLVDYGRGSGAFTLLFRFNNDYTGIKNLVLNGTVRYDLVLPDRETRRVPDDVNRPLTDNKEEVKRNLGDVVELEASGKYTFLEGFNVSLLYKYGFKFKDHISGDQGFLYESLEDETDYKEHIYTAGLSYTTVPMYMEKRFPVPLDVSISYRNRFAGANNIFKSEYVGLGVQIFF